MPWFENLASVFKPAAPPALQLGAFGKHPGWDDHLEDFGLESEAMLGARQLIYARGIGGAIDSAVWDNLPPEQLLAEFKHIFFWFSETDTIVGRMWSSSDRKGRKRYPMIICAQLSNFERGLPLDRLLSALAVLEEQCRATLSATEVHGILRRAREQLRAELLPGATSSYPPPLKTREQLAEAMKLNGEGEELARIGYSVDTQLAAFTAGKLHEKLRRIGMRMLEANALGQHLRLPTVAGQEAGAALFWRDFLWQWLKAPAPLFIAAPLGEPWMDVIVGMPGPKQLFCLRAAPGALPLAQEVPYNLPGGFKERSAGAFAEFCRGNGA